MKHFFLLIISCFLFQFCSNAPDRPAPVMTPAQHEQVNQESAALQAQKAAQNAAASAQGSALHYYCTTHPQIGGGAAGTCSECGNAFTHNQAFHNAPAAPAANGAIPTPPTSAEPAINAAGVYHYTCPNGHTGGGGGATPCGECGTTLVHNTAYHN